MNEILSENKELKNCMFLRKFIGSASMRPALKQLIHSHKCLHSKTASIYLKKIAK